MARTLSMQALTIREEELVAALKPFVKSYTPHHRHAKDDTIIMCPVTVRDLRRAKVLVDAEHRDVL